MTIIKNNITQHWDKRHGEILVSILNLFDEENIRYFIIRNYEGLPDRNSSKDVDIIVEPGKIRQAVDILKTIYKENGLIYFYKIQVERGHNCRGMNIKTNMAIHIDLMEGYFSRGSELFSFDELYKETDTYNDFKILNEFYSGLMVFIYKQFGYKNPVLKQKYRDIIYGTYKTYPKFRELISKLVGNKLTNSIFSAIEERDFDKMLQHSNQLSNALSIYALKKNPIQTLRDKTYFYLEKINRVIFSYNKFSRNFSVMAPDGAGKTTFLEALISKLEFYYVDDKNSDRYSVYHFRPRILPNLGAIGKKIGIQKTDEDFTNPHRSKSANTISSLFRISYYWLDYMIGYSYLVRKDVQFDKVSIFDRYSYDFIVDPGRTKLNLPLWVRKLYVECIPHPKIVFYLDADPEVIYKRKQELTLDEIKRQVIEYKKVARSHKRFVTLDANRSTNESADEALKVILDTFTKKL